MNQLLLLCYIAFSLLSGWILVRWLMRETPFLLTLIGSFILGTAFAVPLTYGFAVLFAKTHEPILFGIVATVFILFIFCLAVLRKDNKIFSTSFTLNITDLLFMFFSLVFSWWMMSKTFRGGENGILFVGSNNIFDFGNALGLIRSFSWGGNLPLSSPFQAGLPYLYHFYFYFYVAIWEYLSVPMVWALNILSTLSFTALLVVVYYLPQILFRGRPRVGILAVLLTITHSTLTFWYLLVQNGNFVKLFREIWIMQTYRFAGPYDGSVISIFMTLNNYVNQRHLAFGVAYGFFLLLCLIRLIDKGSLTPFKNIFLSVSAGAMMYWNIPLSLFTGLVMGMTLIYKKRWKDFFIFFISFTFVISVSLIPFLISWKQALSFLLILNSGGVSTLVPQWNAFQYLWENLGILPFVAFVGYYSLLKNQRVNIFPLVLLFFIFCLLAIYQNRGFDQKFLSFLIIGINVLAAHGIFLILQQKRLTTKIIVILLLFILTISGVVDLFVIKNEFAYPFIDTKLAKMISWIRNNTAKNSIFVSYTDIIDPVVLAGRKNYFGFFGNIGSSDRSQVVKTIYKGDMQTARNNGISYILVPSPEKIDFKYDVNYNLLNLKARRVYENYGYEIYQVNDL